MIVDPSRRADPGCLPFFFSVRPPSAIGHAFSAFIHALSPRRRSPVSGLRFSTCYTPGRLRERRRMPRLAGRREASS